MTLPALSSQSLADQAYRALRTAITQGDLRWGDKITERGLAASLGVSPTPVREALRRLEQEQLVERTGPRSLRVATVSPLARTESSVIEGLGICISQRRTHAVMQTAPDLHRAGVAHRVAVRR